MGISDWAADRAEFSVTLRRRYERLGHQEDIDEAIRAGRQALAATPSDHPDRAAHLNSLCGALRVRFERLRHQDDVNEAVAVGREAVTSTLPGDPGRFGYLSNLGLALRVRFERSGQSGDLDEAIEVGREAVETSPPDHPFRPMLLGNLCGALVRRSESSGQLGDLDEAIEVGREAVRTSPAGYPARSGFLTNLGVALEGRYQRTNPQDNLDDLNAAIEAHREAVESSPPHHPNLALLLSNLGGALIRRFRRSVQFADLDEAAGRLRTGLHTTSGTPLWRVHCGMTLARLLARYGHQLNDIFDRSNAYNWSPVGVRGALNEVYSLLPQVVGLSLTRGDRVHALADFDGLATLAAAAELAISGPAAERAARAWSVLEQGHGVLLGQALDQAADPELRLAHPELADEVAAVRRDLNAATNIAATDIAIVDWSTSGLVEARRRAEEQWWRLTARVRELPGFESFAAALTVEELRGAAGDGAVVAINVTRWRCDALILTRHGVDHVLLPNLDGDDATARARAWLTALSEAPTDSATVNDVLVWLWDVVGEPVLAHLGHTAAVEPGAQWPRVWWMGTGAISVLPLHAAGHHDGRGQAVLDRVVSSYTPTVRMLARARQRAPLTPPRPGDGPALVVADATMAYAKEEAETATAHLGGPPLVGDHVTVAAVRAGLARARWAHLACHGVPADDPSESSLWLGDGRLPAREVCDLDLPGAYLAFLSACTTAFGGTVLPDESFHIASAFQLAGFPHVVCTLWEVNSLVARDFAADFYDSRKDPARATHEAVRRSREREGLDQPEFWAPFIHLGP